MEKTFRIVPYKPEYRKAFVDLNEGWIKGLFKMEPLDWEILGNPEKHIISRGGFILCAVEDETVLGVCSMQRVDLPEYDFEMGKLAVSDSARGRGIGEALCRAAIERAKGLSRKKIYLESNTKLVPAVSLYRKLGFREIENVKPSFERVDIQMEL